MSIYPTPIVSLQKKKLLHTPIRHRLPLMSESFWFISNDLIDRNVILKQLLKSNTNYVDQETPAHPYSKGI